MENQHVDAGDTSEERVHISDKNQHNKPVVYFSGEAHFDVGSKYTVAYVSAIDHPYLGTLPVRTSAVQKRNDDGSFETLNTIYKPDPEGVDQ
jgi:hypothetical protein